MKFRNKNNDYYLAINKYYKEQSWSALEYAHILAQPFLLSHYRVHFLMLKKAVEERNTAEFAGQILRICLVLPGNIFVLLPKNNPGTARVSAFKSFK